MSTVTHRGNKCVSNVRSVLECLVEKSNNFMLETVPDKVGKDPALGDGRAGRQRFTGQTYIQAVFEKKHNCVHVAVTLVFVSHQLLLRQHCDHLPKRQRQQLHLQVPLLPLPAAGEGVDGVAALRGPGLRWRQACLPASEYTTFPFPRLSDIA